MLDMSQKLKSIDKNHKDLSIRQQCSLLELTRAMLYYKPITNNDIWLLNLIRNIWSEYIFFGYRKITAYLKNEHEIIVNKKRVQRLMQQANIKAIYPKPNTSKANKEHHVYPYLLRELTVDRINQVWMVTLHI